jgi:lipopolysaccharide O-acetyltransferase
MKDAFARGQQAVARHGWWGAAQFILAKLAAQVRGLLWGAGQGSRLGAGCRIIGRNSVSIGPNFKAGRGLWLEAISKYEQFTFTPHIVIGARVSLSDDVHISAIHEITIGDDVLVGSRVFIADNQHGAYRGAEQSGPDTPPAARRLVSPGPTIIEARSWIGDGVAIMPGVRIGAGAIIGANAVVTSDIPAEAIAAGVPARVIKRYDRDIREWKTVDPI